MFQLNMKITQLHFFVTYLFFNISEDSELQQKELILPMEKVGFLTYCLMLYSLAGEKQ